MARRALIGSALGILLVLGGMSATAFAATPTRVPGIDVSRFQKVINWQLVAGDGVQFAFVQASRGSGGDCSVVPRECGPDAYYAGSYLAAKTAGIRVGPYHRAFVDGGKRIATVKADARAEADVFIASVGKLVPGDLRPALDMETPFAGMSPANLRRWARTWLNRVRARLGQRAIIYTNLSSWRALGNPTSFARSGYPLWVANWNVSAPLMPAFNWAGRGWRVWQHSSKGKVDGIRGAVDLNWLQGGWNGVTVGS